MRLIAAACLLAFSLVLSHTLSAQRMAVLGDSLSDGGYLFGLRFTDGGGLLWHEYLADRIGYARATTVPFGSSGLNVAIGGSLVEDLQAQVNRLAGRYTHVPGDVDICTLWIGGNDIRDNPTQNMTLLSDEIGVIIGQLVALQFDIIIVPNLPDLGAIPEAPSGFTRAQRTSGSIAFNTTLAAELEARALAHSVTIIQLDVFGLFDQMLLNSFDYGFTNVTEPLNGSGGVPEEYAFWDNIHPTTRSHSLISGASYAMLEPTAPIELISQSIAGDGTLRQTWLADPRADYDVLSGSQLEQLNQSVRFQGAPAYTVENDPPSPASGFYKTVRQ